MSRSTISDFLVQLKDDVLNFVYPQSCPICHKPLARGENQVCQECWETLAVLPAPFCPYCKSFIEDDDSVVGHGSVCLSPPEDRRILAVRSLGTFDDYYQKLIHRFKYGKKLPLGKTLAESLGRAVSETKCFTNCDVVIPVPLHRARQRERGFNQSDILAQGISESTGIALAQGVLKRKRNTKDQTYLNAQQRADNVRGAFVVKEPDRMEGRTVILVDDVMTTGATLNECAGLLRAAGATDVFAATLAVVDAG